ncbi:hypothetical protein H257_19556, partial [Aphanomyces astaci]
HPKQRWKRQVDWPRSRPDTQPDTLHGRIRALGDHHIPDGEWKLCSHVAPAGTETNTIHDLPSNQTQPAFAPEHDEQVPSAPLEYQLVTGDRFKPASKRPLSPRESQSFATSNRYALLQEDDVELSLEDFVIPRVVLAFVYYQIWFQRADRTFRPDLTPITPVDTSIHAVNLFKMHLWLLLGDLPLKKGYSKVFNVLRALSADPWLKLHVIPDSVHA